MKSYKVGLDLGSTTAKIVITNSYGDIVHYGYEKHFADVKGELINLMQRAIKSLGDHEADFVITGSAGMGISERQHIPFLQEVIATSKVIEHKFPATRTLIDIGGEDSKMILFNPGKIPDIRMNGSCAGGTGAFIEQMATLLGISVAEMNSLASEAKHTYPIASRCGVFAKTDVQNLIARNASKADISASIFHAIAIQTVTTLGRGSDIIPGVFFCGGPFAFIPALRKAFALTLNLTEQQYTVHENAAIIPAWGCTFHNTDKPHRVTFSQFITELDDQEITVNSENRLQPLFVDETEFLEWKLEKSSHFIERVSVEEMQDSHCYLGIDSGSTTTKIVAIDENEKVVFGFYARNSGNSLDTLLEGLQQFNAEAKKGNKEISIVKSCATGYGEDLMKTALTLDYGIVETIAHYLAAKKVDPNVSFILDIGGQDMKAIFVENGAINRLEINEACSSGCGSFIETFATALKYKVADFAEEACTATQPCDLGTRCTVFMNSKVKQFLREGASVPDIAAGLSYSVVKNCLYKVLKVKNLSELGNNIVVQGGTLRNKSVVKAFEQLTGKDVLFTDIPELMGAYGAAIYAKTMAKKSSETTESVSLDGITAIATQESKMVHCKGCENNCMVRKFSFANEQIFYSGNKCEKVFHNKGADHAKRENLHIYKFDQIFNRSSDKIATRTMKIGIPRMLNMYENYPFWHTLLSECGITPIISEPSTYMQYEKGIGTVMSDNICFPAKLAHGHIYDLAAKKVDRILMPYVVYEQKDDVNFTKSFNCPIVTGYSDVIKSAIDTSSRFNIPLDAPTISFHDDKLLKTNCVEYLQTFGIDKKQAIAAIKIALAAQDEHNQNIYNKAKAIATESAKNDDILIVLAGRPYHNDPLIQHKISDIISDMGANVVTEDISRFDGAGDYSDVQTVMQWTYTNRIIKAAQWVVNQPQNVCFVQITSFGCGPDAFVIDECADIMRNGGKPYTQLKVDDINNTGSLRLRIRSLIESLKFKKDGAVIITEPVKNKLFLAEDRNKTIIGPFLSEFYSPFFPVLYKHMGYKLEVLPIGDQISNDLGLQFSNNEVCYPATLIIGDIIKALQSGNYNLDEIAVSMTQTGGQCRATNYLAILKKAMVTAGFSHVPIISLAFGGDIQNEQPGFKMKWSKVIHLALAGVLFADCISQMYYATVVREKIKGKSATLRDFYIAKGAECFERKSVKSMYALVEEAADHFNELANNRSDIPKIGVVGEIYLKYNSFSNRYLYQWLSDQGVEVVAPMLSNFFMQTFVNSKVNRENGVERSAAPGFIMDIFYKLAMRYVNKFNKVGAKFRYFTPFANIFDEATHAKEIVNLAAQYGEGWLIPAEIANFAQMGVTNAISLQPFGCIANHVVSKGVAKKITKIYPDMNLLFLDFDGGTSEVNILNRVHFMVDNAKGLMNKSASVSTEKMNLKIEKDLI